MFALFSGLLGTAFSVLVRMELSGPGIQYLADNQLYNSIITAHAILMSAPLCLGKGLVNNRLTNESSCVKNYQDGGVKLHGETQTSKLIVKGVNGTNIQVLRRTPELICVTFRITNLKPRGILYNGNSVERIDRTDALPTLILSWVLELFSQGNGISRKENKNRARNLTQNAPPRNCGITYGNPKRVSKNQLVGDGVVIVGRSVQRTIGSILQVRTITSKAGIIAKRGSEVKKILDPTVVNIKVIGNLKNLTAAYELIKSNPGNMTEGATGETLDGITAKYLENVQSKLKAGKYNFSPARRVHIPKPGKKETRPLTIASPREKIVQKAMLLIMERLYENKFLDTSHGFRPGRGTHTAMKQLESNFQSVRYVIEADFAKAFDSIQPKALMEIIKEDIKCEKTLRLIKSGLKAGYFEFGELHENLTAGTPQGSILSPLLCNIFLHKLDEYIVTLQKEYHKGTTRQRSKENLRLQNKVKYWRAKGYNITEPQTYKTLLKQLLKTDSIRRDDSYVRITYTRYADDFVIGVIGSHRIAKEILSKVETFVNETLKLTFNQGKTGITDFKKDTFKFLGYSIRSPMSIVGVKPLEAITIQNRTITRRKKMRTVIEMDTIKVLQKLSANGFIRKRTSHTKHHTLQYRGKFKGNLINLDHPDIIKYYNSVVRGIQNYYNFSRNRTAVAWIGWLLKESCALTLARKFKLRTASKIFRKLGNDLGFQVNDKSRISFIDTAYTKAINIAKAGGTHIDPLKNIEMVWNAKFTKSKLFAPCVICGSQVDVEMHHVRKIKDMKNPHNKLDFFTRQMAAINRKQVPLCKEHHIGLHNNTWTDSERAIFNYEAKRKEKKR